MKHEALLHAMEVNPDEALTMVTAAWRVFPALCVREQAGVRVQGVILCPSSPFSKCCSNGHQTEETLSQMHVRSQSHNGPS